MTAKHNSEITEKADFSHIRYAQCWEDADILLDGLDIQPGDHCVSIASAGDNALAMLTRNPAKVLAIDLNPAQLFCVELRVAAYRTLTHQQLLILMGSRPCVVSPHQPCTSRAEIYTLCRPLLSEACAAFWDQQKKQINRLGIGDVGKFERYFRIFKRFILPLCHSQKEVEGLFHNATPQARQNYFDKTWNNKRWQWFARLFFSQTVMGKLGRDPSFFAHIEGSFSQHISRKIKYALCHLDPAGNPYLHWILTTTHGNALPLALRKEHFETIRNNLDRLQWQLISIEDLVSNAKATGDRFQKFNLSDIFEYMSEPYYHELLEQLLEVSTPGSRLLYWNMLTPRCAPDSMVDHLKPLTELAEQLHQQDKAFFYNRLIVEEVIRESVQGAL